MRTKLQNPVIASLITILVVLFAALLGGRASLMQMRTEAWALYAGGDALPMGQGSIQSDLESIAANAHNLITVAERNMQVEDPLLEAVRRGAASAMQTNLPAMSAQYAEMLRASVEELNALLASIPGQSAEDERYRQELITNIRSSYKIIGHSNYNALATEFNRKLDQTPASLIATLTGIERLELYD
jgi:hypothetical protein